MGPLILLLVLLATGVVFSYLLVIWWLDRYEREPLWLVILVFLFGGIFGTCFSCLINSTMGAIATDAVGPEAANVFTTVVVAPIVEEVMKGLIFLPLLLFGNHVDNRTDGLIYGAATGLGFATIENLHYYNNTYNPNAPEVVIVLIVIRTIFCALLHCSSSAMLGMAIGHASHRYGFFGLSFFAFLGYIAAVLNHAFWNGMASLSGMTGGGSILLAMVVMVGVATLMFIMTQVSLWQEHKDLLKHLEDEARLGTLPMEHAKIIPFWLKRGKKGWLPESIDKNAYIDAATMLAFRLAQLELAGNRRNKRYMEDIVKYRNEVKDHLRRAGIATGGSGASSGFGSPPRW